MALGKQRGGRRGGTRGQGTGNILVLLRFCVSWGSSVVVRHMRVVCCDPCGILDL